MKDRRDLTRRQRGEHDGHVADRLRELRIEQGYTQAEVATLAGVSGGAYRDWERGRFVPRPGPQLRGLAAVFRCSPGYLLIGK